MPYPTPVLRSIKNIIKKLFPKNWIIFFRLFRLWIQRKKNAKMLRFEVHVVEHCNLNCKGCIHFSPVAKPEFLDITSFERDCQRIALLSDQLREIGILGGEPLLHPNITDFFDTARKYFDNRTVLYLTTNGILLLKQPDSFWENCKKNNVLLSMSRYPVKVNWQEIEQKAIYYHVPFRYSIDKIDTMHALRLDSYGNQNIKKSFNHCMLSTGECTTLRDGKIYMCAVTAHIKHFNIWFHQDFSVSEKCYIDIYKAKDIHEILQFLSKPIPFCRYCKSMKFGLEYGISKKEISEWT